MRIALFPNPQIPAAATLAQEIGHFLAARQVDVVAEEPFSHLDALHSIISIGGDGTILQLLHRYRCLATPILGVNMGHLGFMADVPLDDLYPSLEALLAGAYRVEERLVLQVEGDPELFAVNDIVLHRAENPTLIQISLHIDGLYLNRFEADGVIIATPNGSTAYSLAAGGPIVSPSLDALLITPIAAHTISNRAILVAPHSVVELRCSAPSAELRADGLCRSSLPSGSLLRIRQSEQRFRLINLLRRDYFSTLREKLGWSGTLRNK